MNLSDIRFPTSRPGGRTRSRSDRGRIVDLAAVAATNHRQDDAILVDLFAADVGVTPVLVQIHHHVNLSVTGGVDESHRGDLRLHDGLDAHRGRLQARGRLRVLTREVAGDEWPGIRDAGVEGSVVIGEDRLSRRGRRGRAHTGGRVAFICLVVAKPGVPADRGHDEGGGGERDHYPLDAIEPTGSERKSTHRLPSDHPTNVSWEMSQWPDWLASVT